ncbi:hypothetical protein GW17_00011123 [Ensete ventricosum]|nr:hypothetical protein GW17_00011123 [Ensete ventricosum]
MLKSVPRIVGHLSVEERAFERVREPPFPALRWGFYTYQSKGRPYPRPHLCHQAGHGGQVRATFATVDAKSLLCHLRPGLHQSGLRRISVLSWTADLARVLALQALEVMKSCDDFDSTVSLESLATIRRRYSIPSEYVLPALGLGQCPCHPCPGGFNFSIDALEAGLRFPLHSVI